MAGKVSGRLAAAWRSATSMATEESLAALADAALPMMAHRVAQRLGLGVWAKGQEVRFTALRGGSGSPEDAEDLLGECYVALLRALDPRGEAEPVTSPAAYLRRVVDNCFADWLRHRYPARHRLTHRLRALLSGALGDHGFALWQDEAHTMMCGFTTWQRHRPGRHTRRRLWLDHPGQCLADPADAADPASLPLPYLVSRVLNWVGGPISLSELATGLALLLGLDRPVEEDGAGAFESQASPEPEAAAGLLLEEEVRRIADELAGLPHNQRHAILLALETDELLALAGLVGPQALCDLLRVDASELAQVCQQAPLPDLLIAARLELSRQQVINLRKAGRRRLERHLQGSGADA